MRVIILVIQAFDPLKVNQINDQNQKVIKLLRNSALIYPISGEISILFSLKYNYFVFG